MSEVKNQCKYKCEDTGWECPYEALEDSKEGFCIFHDKREDKNIEKFNEGIRKILQDQESDAYHFEGKATAKIAFAISAAPCIIEP